MKTDESTQVSKSWISFKLPKSFGRSKKQNSNSLHSSKQIKQSPKGAQRSNSVQPAKVGIKSEKVSVKGTNSRGRELPKITKELRKLEAQKTQMKEIAASVISHFDHEKQLAAQERHDLAYRQIATSLRKQVPLTSGPIDPETKDSVDRYMSKAHSALIRGLKTPNTMQESEKFKKFELDIDNLESQKRDLIKANRKSAKNLSGLNPKEVDQRSDFMVSLKKINSEISSIESDFEYKLMKSIVELDDKLFHRITEISNKREDKLREIGASTQALKEIENKIEIVKLKVNSLHIFQSAAAEGRSRSAIGSRNTAGKGDLKLLNTEVKIAQAKITRLQADLNKLDAEHPRGKDEEKSYIIGELVKLNEKLEMYSRKSEEIQYVPRSVALRNQEALQNSVSSYLQIIDSLNLDLERLERKPSPQNFLEISSIQYQLGIAREELEDALREVEKLRKESEHNFDYANSKERNILQKAADDYVGIIAVLDEKIRLADKTHPSNVDQRKADLEFRKLTALEELNSVNQELENLSQRGFVEEQRTLSKFLDRLAPGWNVASDLPAIDSAKSTPKVPNLGYMLNEIDPSIRQIAAPTNVSFNEREFLLNSGLSVKRNGGKDAYCFIYSVLMGATGKSENDVHRDVEVIAKDVGLQEGFIAMDSPVGTQIIEKIERMTGSKLNLVVIQNAFDQPIISGRGGSQGDDTRLVVIRQTNSHYDAIGSAEIKQNERA